MGIRDTLQKATQNVRSRVEHVLTREKGMEPLAVRHEILSQIESRILSDENGKVFPYAKIVVYLQPQTKYQRSAIEDAFLQKNTLKSDVVQLLNNANARFPDELETLIEFRENLGQDQSELSPRPPFEMDFFKFNAPRTQDIPETRLVILKGVAEQAEYQMKKDRIRIGRSREILDREGRMVRKNDIVFLDKEEEINRSVGRTHARIWFNHDTGEYCILDEASRYGTRILRGGSVIEVPSDNLDGICLWPGDEIYFGQACIRFELLP
ncbi:MAG: FHA domain-containing protein [Acidobacteria bacterium]|nr:FHA domain-containing protein [Acidobacteriota bacterium]